MRKLLVPFILGSFLAVACSKSETTPPPPTPVPTTVPTAIPTPVTDASCKTKLPAGTPPPAGSVEYNGFWYTCADSAGDPIACPGDISMLPPCK